MRRILAFAGLSAALSLLPSFLNAQANPRSLDHGELGAYGDLFRVTAANANSVNYLGLGGRLSLNVSAHAALEGEINYDFEQNFTKVSNSGNGTITTVTSSVRPLTGLFGPKFQIGTSGPARAFVTAKAGFIEFSTNYGTASASSFANAFGQFGNGSTHFAAYPGGGFEIFLGALGIRVEAGDEIYVNNGAYNNLRVTFGPTLRF
jgi:hypothetical protein